MPLLRKKRPPAAIFDLRRAGQFVDWRFRNALMRGRDVRDAGNVRAQLIVSGGCGSGNAINADDGVHKNILLLLTCGNGSHP